MAWCCWIGASFAAGEPPCRLQYGEGRELALLRNPDIRESSGLAASRANPDVFWTHNDSGWQPVLFAVDRAGNTVATLNIPTTTAMDISPDGSRAIVLTYEDAFEYVRLPGRTWSQAFAEPGRRVAMPHRVQGESIGYGQDGQTLYLTSECRNKSSSEPSPLLEVPVRKRPAPATP